MDSQPIPAAAAPRHNLESGTRLQGSLLVLARTVWILIAFSATAGLFTVLIWNTVAWWHVTPQSCPECGAYLPVFSSFHLVALYFGFGAAVEMVPWVVVGTLIFWRKSDEPFALLFSLGLVLAGTMVIDTVVPSVIQEHFQVFGPVARILSFLSSVLLVSWFCFPDGRFVSSHLRRLAAVWIGLVTLSFVFPHTALSYESWPAPLPQTIQAALAVCIALSLVYRYRRVAGLVERQQIRWIVTTGTFFIAVFAPSSVIWYWAASNPLLAVIVHVTYEPFIYIGSAVFALGIGVSVFRYRLWDIDIFINRTLVYGALTAVVIGIYVLLVGALGTMIQGHSNLLISVLATGLVAALVQPLRDRLQRSINRVMYGDRDDPVTVLTRLGQRLQATIAPDAVLPALVETIAQALKLPYVAIEQDSDRGTEPRASYGRPSRDLVQVPLFHQGEAIGWLVVAPRAPGEALSPGDYHLLEGIAHQAGLALHAVSLTLDLQRSRQRLITAREEERRRLRRDLHDGLGPNLASQGLKLAAARQLVEKDPSAAILLLDQIVAQNQSTVDEVRMLVYGLRPPALDEFGLVAAIRDYSAAMDGKASLQIAINEPEGGLPALSAAVEVAAYRIVLEALTNVIRHAHARNCSIRFSLKRENPNPVLHVAIEDDGIGMTAAGRAGVGTRSMRERAEEVGGTCVIESVAAGGTRVAVSIPLMDA